MKTFMTHTYDIDLTSLSLPAAVLGCVLIMESNANATKTYFPHSPCCKQLFSKKYSKNEPHNEIKHSRYVKKGEDKVLG